MEIDGDYCEEKFLEDKTNRIYNIVNRARIECGDKVCPVDIEDFCDLLFNGGGYITKIDEILPKTIDPRYGNYYCQYLECMNQGFKTTLEDRFMYIKR